MSVKDKTGNRQAAHKTAIEDTKESSMLVCHCKYFTWCDMSIYMSKSITMAYYGFEGFEPLAKSFPDDCGTCC